MDNTLRIDSRTWFSADHHFGHINIISYCHRPWPDVTAMNEGLIARHNAVVGKDDTVVLLGDLSLSPRWLDEAAKMHGRKYLIPGNHDRCWGHHRKRRPRDITVYEDAGFTVLADEVTLGLPDGREVYACHLPYRGDHTEQDRYQQVRPADRGMALLCGHVHDTWREHGRMLNVGVDVNDYTPVPLSAVQTWLDENARPS
jgi:calcineurin-like phosphoesterase family protein